jgi:hypothetical protein
MAIYKIFPEKSATLYSYYPTLNAGIDEILDLSTYFTIDGNYEVARPIIQFPQSELLDVINNKVSGSQYSAFLKLSLAQAFQLPQDYTIYCHPLSGSWNVGTGRLANVPTTVDGVSWQFKNYYSGSTWFTSFPAYTTGSYKSTGIAGGGLWFTSSNYVSTQSFSNVDSKDIVLNVTNTVVAWTGSILPNSGFILKHANSIEFASSSLPIELKYFSGNTHTIYPPCLEIRWNDYIYNTGSLSFLTSPSIVATLANNQSEYQQDSVQRFRVNIRDRFPARAFSSTSVYLVNKVFLERSNPVYQIKDLDTEEIVVDYDSTYTRVCADPTGNYFDVYMNGLEPERYYKILIKATINGTTIVLDDNYYFKVIR